MSDESIGGEFADPFDPQLQKRQREKAQALGKQQAQRFLAFETNPELIALLQDWQHRVLDTVLSTNATLQEYAAHNAQRSLILGIMRTIELAKGV
jgi:hypothetical protein